MTAYSTFWRGAAILMGLALAALGAYGAWEYAKALEGTVSYVVLAAPVVGIAAATLPSIAEWQWREGAWVKSALLWVAFALCGAVVFSAVAERMHTAKAGGEAERAALSASAGRAKTTLTTLEAEAKVAKTAADVTKGWKRCGPKCEGIRATAVRLEGEAAEARTALVTAEAKAVAESSLKAPVWLLGAALWVAEVLLLWAGLTGPRPKVKQQRKRRKPKAKRKPKPKAPTPDHGNVVRIKAA